MRDPGPLIRNMLPVDSSIRIVPEQLLEWRRVSLRPCPLDNPAPSLRMLKSAGPRCRLWYQFIKLEILLAQALKARFHNTCGKVPVEFMRRRKLASFRGHSAEASRPLPSNAFAVRLADRLQRRFPIAGPPRQAGPGQSSCLARANVSPTLSPQSAPFPTGSSLQLSEPGRLLCEVRQVTLSCATCARSRPSFR